MGIPLFLAMTAAEVLPADELPRPMAWMACHFSAYGTGLSNLPMQLPEGSMLILNDRMPPDRHDHHLAADTLVHTAQRFGCGCILLDFQRPGNDKTASVVEAVLEKADCPVGVSSSYGEGLSCPVLVPPLPPHLTAQEYLAPWQGREIWMEVGLSGTEISVTPEGSRYAPLPHFSPDSNTHREEGLHCHYEITVTDEQILFRLGRTSQDIADLLAQAENQGVTQGVGLWQELRGSLQTSFIQSIFRL